MLLKISISNKCCSVELSTIKEYFSTKIKHHSGFNIENNWKSFLKSPKQHIWMISEASYGTEDWIKAAAKN